MAPKTSRPERHLTAATSGAPTALDDMERQLADFEHAVGSGFADLRAAIESVRDAARSAPVPSVPILLLTREQVAESLGCSPSQVSVLFRRGDIRFVKIGALTRVHRADLEIYVESLRAAS